MKIRILCYAAAMLLVLCFAAPGFAADVAQGKCVSYDQDKKIVVMEEYDTNKSKENPHGKPTGKQSSFDLSSAQVGATPDPGNILRIAYRDEGGKKLAYKMMNVTKTDIMKK